MNIEEYPAAASFHTNVRRGLPPECCLREKEVLNEAVPKGENPLYIRDLTW